MYSSSSVASVNYQARALCPQYASKDFHRFLVGTCSLHDSNELNILQYYEDSNHFDIACSFSHPDQIWGVEASPKDASMVVTSRQSAQSASKCLTLWKMPKQSDEDMEAAATPSAGFHREQYDLEEVTSFNHSEKASCVRDVKWHNSENSLLTVDNRMLSTWSIGDGKISLQNGLPLHGNEDGNNTNLISSSSGSTGKKIVEEGCVAWDPHASKQCAVGIDRSLRIVDTREMEVCAEQPGAHAEAIRSVDYNPNKPLVLVTAGNDRRVKFWDMRNFNRPLKVLAGHTHWIWSAKYNPYHDQLVVSGGSDNVLNLWRIASCSSAPWLGSADDNDANDPPDVKVRMLNQQHEDSIYRVAWSPADAWIYCSLSFDGRVIVNHVPSTEKYKILL